MEGFITIALIHSPLYHHTPMLDKNGVGQTLAIQFSSARPMRRNAYAGRAAS